MQKFAFRMQLNPGMEAEYRARHDAIWPELVALLKDAGIGIIRSISTPRATLCSASCGGATITGWRICPPIR